MQDHLGRFARLRLGCRNSRAAAGGSHRAFPMIKHREAAAAVRPGPAAPIRLTAPVVSAVHTPGPARPGRRCRIFPPADCGPGRPFSCYLGLVIDPPFGDVPPRAGIRSPLGHMGVEVPRDFNPRDSVGACEQGHATARERLSIPARAMRSHRRGENVVTITSIRPRSTDSGRAMMHSARDLQTRLRIDLAIQIGSAIGPVPYAHAQVTADRRPGAGPGLL